MRRRLLCCLSFLAACAAPAPEPVAPPVESPVAPLVESAPAAPPPIAPAPRSFPSAWAEASGLPDGPLNAVPPDVVVVVIDTLRADRTSLLDPAATPGLAAWARGGRAYAQAIAPSSWTLPSVAATLAGRELRANHKRVPADWTLLPARLAAAGYETAAVVANPVLARDAGLAESFSTYEVTDGLPWSADDVLARADAWLARPRTGPRFLYLHLMDPHTPYRSPEAAGVPGWSDGLGSSVGWPVGDRAACIERWRRRYDGEVATVDAALAPWLARQTALVAVFGDHGEGLFSHRLADGARNKIRHGPRGCGDELRPGYDDHGRQRHEEAIRVPLWLVGPGVSPGVEERPVRLVDLARTLLSLAGNDSSPRLPLTASEPAAAVVLGVDKGGSFARTATRKLLRDPSGDSVVPVSLQPAAASERPLVEPDTAVALGALLDAWSAGAAEALAPAPDTKEALKALGYIE